MSAPTHAELVHAALWWLRGSMGCRVAVAECGSALYENPDAIGWGTSGFSILVECKTSRADFLADRKKPFRAHPEVGMGSHRWYFTPRGLLDPRELPAGWGLAELRGTRVRKVNQPETFTERNTRNEMQILVSAVARLTGGLGLQVFDPPTLTPIRVCADGAVLAPGMVLP